MLLENPITGFDLSLRQMTPDDLPFKVAWYNDPDVRKSLVLDELLQLDKTIQWFHSAAGSPTRLDLMIQPAGREPVGLISLVNIDSKNRTAEIVLVIGSAEFWGKGVMLHAESLLIGWAFSQLKLEKIWAQSRTDNIASLVTMKKLGFVVEGTRRQEKLIGGRRIDLFHLGLLPAEFRPAK